MARKRKRGTARSGNFDCDDQGMSESSVSRICCFTLRWQTRYRVACEKKRGKHEVDKLAEE